MKISSTAFVQGQPIPAKFTCDGENINPVLAISDVPQGTKSLALILDDPDSPTGTWIHWLVWNIDPSLSEIAENSIPGIEGLTSFGNVGYGGPCPGSGEHRYFFRLYALDTELDLSAGAGKDQLTAAMTGRILAEAEVMGVYQRN